ncbi:MAG: hypothetical protein AAGE52_35925 [Myxococcota bacterium]
MNDFERVTIDISSFPIVEAVFPPRPTIETVDDYMDRVAELTQTRAFGLLADTRRVQAGTVTAKVRARLNERIAALEAGAGKGLCLCEAVVIANPVLKLMFTAYTWTKMANAHPTRAFRTRVDARDWLVAVLARDGLQVPD